MLELAAFHHEALHQTHRLFDLRSVGSFQNVYQLTCDLGFVVEPISPDCNGGTDTSVWLRPVCGYTQNVYAINASYGRAPGIE